MTSRTFWTDERKEALARDWAAGISQTEIARRLSTPEAPCTKNMVKSKAGQMQLPVRDLGMPRREMVVEARAEPEVTHPEHDERGCRWPHGDPRDRKNFRFCGARQLPDRPYCSEHTALAYVKPPAQRAA